MEYFNYSNEDPRELVNAKFEAYQSYLKENKETFPSGAYEFASAEWHYDPEDPRCPHDAWVNRLSILERIADETEKNRVIDIEVELLGAYHDGTIQLTYTDVSRYDLQRASSVGRFPSVQSHGDWIIDEILLVPESRKVTHEIKFWLEATWTIECSDILYSWVPFGSTE